MWSIFFFSFVWKKRESPAGDQFWKFSRQCSIFGRDQWVAILSSGTSKWMCSNYVTNNAWGLENLRIMFLINQKWEFCCQCILFTTEKPSLWLTISKPYRMQLSVWTSFEARVIKIVQKPFLILQRKRKKFYIILEKKKMHLRNLMSYGEKKLTPQGSLQYRSFLQDLKKGKDLCL